MLLLQISRKHCAGSVWSVARRDLFRSHLASGKQSRRGNKPALALPVASLCSLWGRAKNDQVAPADQHARAGIFSLAAAQYRQ